MHPAEQVRAKQLWDPAICLHFGLTSIKWLLHQLATLPAEQVGGPVLLRYEPSSGELLLLARHVDSRVAAQARSMLEGTRPGAGDDARGLLNARLVLEPVSRQPPRKKKKR